MIGVDGLAELRRELKAIEAQRELGKVHKRLSGFVARKSDQRRQRLSTRYRSYKKLAGTLKPSASQSYAQVRETSMLAYVGEFGAYVHPVFGRPTPQRLFTKQVWPMWSREGYLVYPTIRENTDEIVEMYGDGIDEMTKRAFPDGR